jgi:hypothetical protein
VDAAQPGDTVVVLPGTYHEAVCVTTDGIDLRGNGAVILPPAEPPSTPCSVIPAGIFLLGQLDFATGVVSDPISDAANDPRPALDKNDDHRLPCSNYLLGKA